MSFVPFPSLEAMMAPGFEHRYIVAMAEASKEYEDEQLKKAALRDKPVVKAETPPDEGSDNE